MPFQVYHCRCYSWGCKRIIIDWQVHVKNPVGCMKQLIPVDYDELMGKAGQEAMSDAEFTEMALEAAE